MLCLRATARGRLHVHMMLQGLPWATLPTSPTTWQSIWMYHYAFRCGSATPTAGCCTTPLLPVASGGVMATAGSLHSHLLLHPVKGRQMECLIRDMARYSTTSCCQGHWSSSQCRHLLLRACRGSWCRLPFRALCGLLCGASGCCMTRQVVCLPHLCASPGWLLVACQCRVLH